MSPGAKKLVLVLAISTPVSGTREKTVGTVNAVGTAKAVKTMGADKNGEESKVVLGMPFLTLSSANIDFLERELW